MLISVAVGLPLLEGDAFIVSTWIEIEHVNTPLAQINKILNNIINVNI